MGYTTDFTGSVTIEPKLNPAEISYLNDFAKTRRVDRTGGPLYVGHDVPGYTDDFGQGEGTDLILNGNQPHKDQPGLWNQWVPTESGTEIEWDGGEKFYNAAEWMKYLVENLLAPSARPYLDAHMGEDPRLEFFTANHVVNGEIEAQGEDYNDRWALVVKDNAVAVAEAVVTYQSPRSL